MYHRVKRKMYPLYLICLVLIVQHIDITYSISIVIKNENTHEKHEDVTEYIKRDKMTKRQDNEIEDNNIIDFDSEYDKKINNMYENRHNNNNKNVNKYIIVKDNNSLSDIIVSTTSEMPLPMELTTEVLKEKSKINVHNVTIEFSTNHPLPVVKTTEADVSVVPLELLSTTDATPVIVDSTTEPDLTVIPLSTTKKSLPNIEVDETATLPVSTEPIDETTTELVLDDFTESEKAVTTEKGNLENIKTSDIKDILKNITNVGRTKNETKSLDTKTATTLDDIQTNATEIKVTIDRNDREILEEHPVHNSEESEAPNIFTALDAEEEEEVIDVPEDYYDSKDLVPTKAPTTDALSVLFGFAGSVVESMVESVAERVVPKGLYDLFKRMQRQSEALEAERLRSREENGGLGQFGRGILKTLSSGLSKPLSQLMGARDNGSLDSDRSFVSSLASGVSSVATSVVDTFKDRVQAIYPGTVWCGDGRSPTARSSELGLFFFTDTCCRQHDACKMYIRAGETKHGLTNTGLFTRSHCSCDTRFRECLRRTNSLISAQIGLTYFNVLGPQCFRRAHPIVRCVTRTRITGQKCEEYELDFTKPKMWQWFDNETF